jgi:hypothetical protein
MIDECWRMYSRWGWSIECNISVYRAVVEGGRRSVSTAKTKEGLSSKNVTHRLARFGWTMLDIIWRELHPVVYDVDLRTVAYACG